MNSLAECLSCCSPLKVSVLQNVNWVSGANGVPAWRRTKHVASEKDPSHGTVGPFCWSKAHTPLPLPLFPHKLALHRQRGGSAQWSRHLAREVRGRRAAFKKKDKLHSVVAADPKWPQRPQAIVNWEALALCRTPLMLSAVFDGTVTQHPLGLSLLPVCLWPTVCWSGLVWPSLQKDTEYLDFAACKQKNPAKEPSSLRGMHYTLWSWTAIIARKSYLFKRPV